MIACRWLTRCKIIAAALSILLVGPSCAAPNRRATLIQENQSLRTENQRLQRSVGQQDATIGLLQQQVRHLKGFDAKQPADLFAPVKIEFGTLSGGADYDGKPGDDGVTVYLRLRDADADIVKAPGKITIQLLDNTNLREPRILGIYSFDQPDQLRQAWHGKFGTRHYTLKCPFAKGVDLPDTGQVDVKAEFIDYLTGATLTAVETVTITRPVE